MSDHRHHHHRPIEPLPGDFDSDLASIDELLAHDLRQPPPPGLADRVFEASVTMLPDSRPLRLVRPAAARQWLPQRSTASRLAMAASVGLAIVLGIVFLRSPATPAGTGVSELALVDPAVARPHRDRRATTEAFSADAEWVILDSMRLAHYSEARTLTLADVNSDLAQLMRELEM